MMYFMYAIIILLPIPSRDKLIYTFIDLHNFCLAKYQNNRNWEACLYVIYLT